MAVHQPIPDHEAFKEIPVRLLRVLSVLIHIAMRSLKIFLINLDELRQCEPQILNNVSFSPQKGPTHWKD